MNELISRGGIMIWPLLLLSVLGLALIVYNFCLLRAVGGRARRAVSGAAELGRELERLQQGVEHLFLIASIAPVCGLLGTVLGIIKSFAALSLTRPDSQILSLGLSEALLTTAAGLTIALPCQVAGHFLQQGLDRLFFRLRKGKTEEGAA